MVRSAYKPYLIIVVLFSLFFFFFPLVLIHNGGEGSHKVFLLLMFPALGIFLFYASFQKCPRVVLDREFITIKSLTNTKTFSWSDVREVFLSRKEYYLGQSMEATVVIFNNQDKLILWDQMYSNTNDLRNFINLQAKAKEKDPVPNVTERSIYSVNRRVYSGNVFISFNTLLLLGMAIFFFVAIKGNIKRGPVNLIPFVFMIAFYFALGTQMNYFLIDDGYLVIKNHYFPWQSKKLSLNDIGSVDIETPYRRSTGLRILSKNLKSKIYGAGSLRNHTWKDLMNDLTVIGISVRDDR